MSQIAWYWWSRRSRGIQTWDLRGSFFMAVSSILFFYTPGQRESQLSFRATARKLALSGHCTENAFTPSRRTNELLYLRGGGYTFKSVSLAEFKDFFLAIRLKWVDSVKAYVEEHLFKSIQKKFYWKILKIELVAWISSWPAEKKVDLRCTRYLITGSSDTKKSKIFW